MDGYPYLYFEEDTKTKGVIVRLVNHRFGLPDISVKYPFEIRLGRKILSIDSEGSKKNSPQTFKPRAVVPIHINDGKILLIVEVKTSNKPCDDRVKEQQIRYAHLTPKGDLTPFVALTSGCETKIYGSISDGFTIGTTLMHYPPINKAGFHISMEGFASRVKGLEIFTSLQELVNEHFKPIYQAFILTYLRIFLCKGDEEYYGLT